MGCSNTKSSTSIDDTKAPAASKMENLPKEYPASEAFTIPLDSLVESSSEELALNETLRQPPKRIQQLIQEAANTEPLTLEELEDKQQKAEQRRQELMQQKLEVIQKNTQMLMRGPVGEGEDESKEEHNEQE